MLAKGLNPWDDDPSYEGGIYSPVSKFLKHNINRETEVVVKIANQAREEPVFLKLLIINKRLMSHELMTIKD